MPAINVIERRKAYKPVPPSLSVPVVRRRRPAFQAYMVLYVTFILLPLVAGVDKFFDLFVNWDAYLSPLIAGVAPFGPHQFMMGVGAVEIFAAFVVGVAPSIGGWVVAVWLWGIVINLLLIPGFYDIILRDLGLSAAALALSRLSRD
jgi:hypothetical protein